MLTIEHLIARLPIDKHDLDNELVQQPVLYHTVADKLAVATDDQIRAKDALEQTEATADRHIRAAADADGKKLTESAVKAQLAVNPAVIGATDNLREATSEVAKLAALRESYAQRSYMVRELCNLFTAGYWQTNGTSVKLQANEAPQASQGRQRLTAARNNSKK